MATILALEVVEVLGLLVILTGYIPIVVAYRRHRMKWTFAAYTTIFLAITLEIIGELLQIELIWATARMLGSVAGGLFVASTYLSQQTINKMQAEATEVTE